MSMVDLFELSSVLADLVDRVLVNEEVLHLVDTENFLQRKS